MTAANFISGMIGVTIGALFGFTFAAILIIGRQSDPREPEDREYSLGIEDKIVAIEDNLRSDNFENSLDEEVQNED